MFRKRKNLVWCILVGLIGFFVYFPGLDIHYYGDDYHHVFNKPYKKLDYYFIDNNPRNPYIYRPLQTVFLVSIQKHFGMETFPIHVTIFIFHILLSWLVYFCMLKLKFTRTDALLGSLFMLLSQANAFAVLSVDTLSQVGGTFLCYLSLWLLYKSYWYPSERDEYSWGLIYYKKYILSILLFLVALFTKETCASFFSLLFIMVILQNLKSGFRFQSIKKVVWEFIPFVLVLLIFLAARNFAGVHYDTNENSRYAFNFGLNIFSNLAMSLFAASIPFSSIDGYTTLKNGEYLVFSLIALTSLIFIGFTIHGLSQRRRLNIFITIFTFSIICLFPMVLMQHVSELYVYNCMPFISILVGSGLGWYFRQDKKRLATKIIVSILFLAICISHIRASRNKAFLMIKNGELATSLIDRIMPYVEQIPPNGELLLMNPPSDKIEYSVFVINGFNVLEESELRFNQLSGRDDFTIRRIEATDFEKIKHKSNQLILTLRGEKVEVYNEVTE